MTEEIPLPPQIPAQLRLAASKGSLVPFVGAGLSMLAGCPDWNQFSGGALKVFADAGKINYSQLSQIRTLAPRTQMSLAMAMAKEHRIAIDFENLLKPAGARLKDEGIRAYASLGKLASTFVTTNYEDLLDTVIPVADDSVKPQEPSSVPVAAKRNVYTKVEEFTYAALNQGNSVFHIHGTVADPSGMILTTRDYPKLVATVLENVAERRSHFGDYEGHLKRALEIIAKHGERDAAVRLADRMRDMRGMPELFASLTK